MTVPHQVCTFHVLREVTKAVLSAVAQERKRLAAAAPKLPRGRPVADKAARRGPPQEADPAEGRRVVRAPLPVRPEASESLRAGDVAADHPRVARSSAGCAADGRGLPAVRPAVPDGHGAGQAGGVAGPVAAVRWAAGGVEEAAVAGPGEGAGVPGRAADGGDVQRGGAGQPAVPEDAEDGVPGADEAGDRGPLALDLLRESQAQGRASTTKALHKARAA